MNETTDTPPTPSPDPSAPAHGRSYYESPPEEYEAHLQARLEKKREKNRLHQRRVYARRKARREAEREAALQAAAADPTRPPPPLSLNPLDARPKTPRNLNTVIAISRSVLRLAAEKYGQWGRLRKDYVLPLTLDPDERDPAFIYLFPGRASGRILSPRTRRFAALRSLKHAWSALLRWGLIDDGRSREEDRITIRRLLTEGTLRFNEATELYEIAEPVARPAILALLEKAKSNPNPVSSIRETDQAAQDMERFL